MFICIKPKLLRDKKSHHTTSTVLEYDIEFPRSINQVVSQCCFHSNKVHTVIVINKLKHLYPLLDMHPKLEQANLNQKFCSNKIFISSCYKYIYINLNLNLYNDIRAQSAFPQNLQNIDTLKRNLKPSPTIPNS